MSQYLVLEIGRSAYTEFKMKNGRFAHTEDAILVEQVEANSEEEAYSLVLNSEDHKDKEFHRLMVKKLADDNSNWAT